jgi:hypothetical protein
MWRLALAALLVGCGGGKDSDSGEDLSNVVAPEPTAIDDFGSVAVHDTGGFTGDIEVDVPSDAVSSLAWCGGFGDRSLGTVWYVTDPDGTVVYDADAPDLTRYRSEYLDDLSPALLPITPALDLKPGIWKFNWWIGGNNPGSVDCGAVHRTWATGAKAIIKVDLVFVGAGGLDAGSAPDDASFQAALAQLEKEWGSAGLRPAFTYVDFSGDLGKYAVVDVEDDDYTEFNDLLRTTSNAGARTRMTFFLVDEIVNNSQGGATILGLSAGPPGAASVHGTSKSGVIVSAIDVADAPEDVGKIMAHEGGHFLGLFHTTEKSGGKHDPIPDTPQCTDDADGNGTMNTSECTGKGSENVMWWTLTSGNATLSGDQGWVLRRNPVTFTQ